ncbi:MAG TPA: hypothetical protein PK961_01180 [bacterium]|nr:hypothetical protein [bacterium]
MLLDQFIDYLIRRTELKEHTFSFPRHTTSRFVWGQASNNEILLSLKPDSYLSHYSATFIHELTEKIPRVHYVTHEQSPKDRRNKIIEQSEIEDAFNRPVRVSNNFATFKKQRVFLLNGMHTGQLGVIHPLGETGEVLSVTNVERTLIDIVVRPNYGGGVAEVLQAFRLAKGRLSTNNLLATYKQLNFVYPYHQAIGFYLERAGYGAAAVRAFRALEMKYDFYLDHNMRETSYNKPWRLYVPANF